MKTDKVIYRTRTQEEYDWLMDRLDEAGCKWLGGGFPADDDWDWAFDMVGLYILVNHKTISYSEDDTNFKGYDYIRVSDLMETEEETDAIEELEAIHKQLTNQIADLRKQGKELKAVEYTIRVCFE